MSGATILNFGCRLNIAEGEAIRAFAAGQDDLVVVNSCAVTAEAVRQARKAIRHARRVRPDARIVVTGCAATLDPAGFAAMPEVARVIGNREKLAAASFLPSPAHAPPSSQRTLGSREVGDGAPPSEIPAPAGMTGWAGRGTAELATDRPHTRAFVAVQNGCDHRCTFCVIPFARGDSRSVPAGLVIERIAAALDAGCNEAVLTGVDLTAYGADLPGAPTLGMLVERILRHVPRLARLRLSSLDSVEIDDRLLDLVTGEPRLMPHLHLSLQAGDDLILKRMKRRHSRAQAVALVERVKAARPEIAIGADLIAGFPTEDERQAANSLALIADCDIVFGHVFPYSPRPGTPAARMPQVPAPIVRMRARALREATETQRKMWLASLVGSVQHVLVESDGRGHAANHADARVTGGAARGSITAIRVASLAGDTLVGAAL